MLLRFAVRRQITVVEDFGIAIAPVVVIAMTTSAHLNTTLLRFEQGDTHTSPLFSFVLTCKPFQPQLSVTVMQRMRSTPEAPSDMQLHGPGP
jgi:hypothetical protein